MSFTVIHDAEKGVAALIDPELGRALGPILTGESAVEILEKFAQSHGVDPATIPQHTLDARWHEFVKALVDVEDMSKEAVKEIEEIGDAAKGEHPTNTEPGKDTAPPSAPDHAESPAGDSAGSDTAAAGTTGEGANAPTASEDGPVTEAKPGNSVCPTCSGFRTVPEAGTVVKCPTCDGKGEILAAQPEPTA